MSGSEYLVPDSDLDILLLITFTRQQPWCTYALHIATFTSLAFVMDPFIPFALWKATANFDPETRKSLLIAQIIFVFGFTKVVKLMGLFRRNPSDIVYLPLSIVFGYFHGLIKLYALFTLNMVCCFRPLRVSLSQHTTNTSTRHPGAAEPMVISTTRTVSARHSEA